MKNKLTLAPSLAIALLAHADGDLINLALTGPDTRSDVLATHARFDVVVTGLIARTRLTQRFVNELDECAEGRYVLPLPDDAAVDRMRTLVGNGRVLPLARSDAAVSGATDGALLASVTCTNRRRTSTELSS